MDISTRPPGGLSSTPSSGGGQGWVGDAITVLNPLTTLLNHVVGALLLQLTVLVVGRSDSILEERARVPFASSFQ